MIDIDKIVKNLKNAKQPQSDFVKLMDSFNDPYLVLIACILSLRTNDRTTYPATLRMLELGKTPEDFAKCDPEVLAKAIYPVGFYTNKAKQIVELSKQLNLVKQLDLEYTMTTNTTLLHKYTDFLVANNFRLLISLDGNEKCHSYRTFGKDKKNSFHRVIKNLDKLQRDYPEYFLTNVSFNAVLHDRNSIKEIYEFIYNRYNKIPRISELNTRNVRSCNKDRFNSMYQSVTEGEIEFRREESDLTRLTHRNSLLYKELTDFLKYTSINYYISNVRELLYNIEKQLPTSTCTPFSKKVLLLTLLILM